MCIFNIFNTKSRPERFVQQIVFFLQPYIQLVYQRLLIFQHLSVVLLMTGKASVFPLHFRLGAWFCNTKVSFLLGFAKYRWRVCLVWPLDIFIILWVFINLLCRRKEDMYWYIRRRRNATLNRRGNFVFERCAVAGTGVEYHHPHMNSTSVSWKVERGMATETEAQHQTHMRQVINLCWWVARGEGRRRRLHCCGRKRCREIWCGRERAQGNTYYGGCENGFINLIENVWIYIDQFWNCN